MQDWNHKEIAVAHSKGGVIVTAHPYDNLIRPDYVSWPPSEIIQKLYQSRHAEAFAGPDKQVSSSGLGYYCDLQSIHSEDAITWSVFGTVARGTIPVITDWLAEFFRLLDLRNALTNSPEIFLWRRLPHPDTLVSGGPEIDAGILTENAVILVEAKWQSGIGSKQGKMKDKNQIQLRCEFLTKYGSRFFPNRNELAVVGISLASEAFVNTTPSGITFRSATWEQVCGLDFHPQAEELGRYFRWKKEHTKMLKNAN